MLYIFFKFFLNSMISYNLGYVDVRDGGDLGFEERLDIHNDEQNIEGGQPQKLLPTKCR